MLLEGRLVDGLKLVICLVQMQTEVAEGGSDVEFGTSRRLHLSTSLEGVGFGEAQSRHIWYMLEHTITPQKQQEPNAATPTSARVPSQLPNRARLSSSCPWKALSKPLNSSSTTVWFFLVCQHPQFSSRAGCFCPSAKRQEKSEKLVQVICQHRILDINHMASADVDAHEEII